MKPKKDFIYSFLKPVLLVTGFLVFTQIAFSQSIAYKALLMTLYENGFPVLKPGEVTDLKKFAILDAREEVEFQVSHLPDAKWVGFDTFSMENVAGLDKKKPVLIYCTVGARSQEIGKRLKAAGFEQVYNLYGGIIEWSNEGRELESKGKPTTKVHTYSKSWGIWLTKGEKVY